MDWREERMEIILGPLKRDVPSVKPGLPAPCWKVKGFSGTSYLDPHPRDCCCNVLETNLKNKKLKNIGLLFSGSDRICYSEKNTNCLSNLASLGQ